MINSYYQTSKKDNISKNNIIYEKDQRINTLIRNFSEVCYIERDFSAVIAKMNEYNASGITDFVDYLKNNFQVVNELHTLVKVVDINEKVIKLFEGQSKDEVIKFLTRPIEDHSLHVDAYIYILNLLNSIYNENVVIENKTRESYIITMKGNRKEIIVNTDLLEEDKPIYITLMIDVSSLITAQNELYNSELRFRTIFENFPVGLLLHSHTTIKDANREYCELLKIPYEEKEISLIGRNIFDFIPEKEFEKLYKLAELRRKGDAPNVYSSYAKDINGNIYPVEIRISLIQMNDGVYTLTYIRDISDDIKREKENQYLQEKMMESHKLESLGILSGGIAHDFNNHLATILGGLSLLQDSKNLSKEELKILDDIVNATREASDVTNQLLTYTGKHKAKSQIIDLVEYIGNIKGMIRLSVPNNIILKYTLEKKIPMRIEVNQSQLTQIFMNLIINAADAIGEKSGLIEIVTEYMDLGEYGKIEDEWTDKYAIIKIIDNGIGIKPENLNKIFDPFYTSKEKGRGLGLSVVQGIINQLNGSIEVNSLVGQGTEISINIPLTDKKNETKIEEIQIPEDNSPTSILIIEDEKIIQKMLKRMLVKLGYNVIVASNGREGIDIYQYKRKEIDLVILDLSMPVMSGEECFSRMIEINNELPVIISSGYSGESMHHFSNYEFVDFLQKPYTIRELKMAIQKLLKYQHQRLANSLK